MARYSPVTSLDCQNYKTYATFGPKLLLQPRIRLLFSNLSLANTFTPFNSWCKTVERFTKCIVELLVWRGSGEYT